MGCLLKCIQSEYKRRHCHEHAPPSPPRHQDRRHARPGHQLPGAAGADDPAQGQRGAAELQPRHGAGPHRPRRRWCARRRAEPAARWRSWPTCRARRSASASSPKARSGWSRARSSCSTRARTELGDVDAVGLDYKDLPRDVKAGDTPAAERRADRAHGRCRQGRSGAHHRAPGRRAVEQQGHQQAGRRPHRAGADGQGHGGHQDRDELPGRLRGRELPEERDRHGNGAPAVQRGGGRVRPQARA